MKKYLLFAFLTVTFCLLLLGGNSAEVAFCDDGEFDFQKSTEEQVDALDFSALESLDLDFGSFGADQGFADYVKSVISGDISFDYSDLIKYALTSFIKPLSVYFSILIGIVIVCALTGILKGLTGGSMGKGVCDLVTLTVDLAMAAALAGVLYDAIKDVLSTTEAIYSLINAAFPVLLMIMAASGDVASIGFYSPVLSAFSLMVITFLKKIICPLLLAILVFSLVGRASDSIKLKKTTAALRSATDALVGAVFGLYMTFLGVGGLSVGAADGTMGKLAKYFLKGYVPVLGVYLTDGLDMLALSLSAIKNGVGIVGVIALLSLALAPVLKIITLSLTFKFASAIAEPLGADKLSDVLEDLSKGVGRMSIVLLGLCFASAMTLIFTVSA